MPGDPGRPRERSHYEIAVAMSSRMINASESAVVHAALAVADEIRLSREAADRRHAELARLLDEITVAVSNMSGTVRRPRT